MNLIAASSAFSNPGRDLPQHQAVLTLIKDRLEQPSSDTYHWLDLACGRGQILTAADRVLPPIARKRIQYVGIDARYEYVLETEKLAKSLFGNARVLLGDLSNVDRLLEPPDRFDAITCTNTVHEVTPTDLAEVLVSSLCRTAQNGFLFLYDMERLPVPELGAISWTAAEVETLIGHMLDGCCATGYSPSAAVWQHTTCTGWQMQIRRSCVALAPEQLADRRVGIKARLVSRIEDVLKVKLVHTNAALTSLSRYGPKSADEAAEIHRLLHDYWAISRALGSPSRYW